MPLRAPPPRLDVTAGILHSTPSAITLVCPVPTLSAGGLAIGGNEALRGQGSYGLLGANAVVAAPYGFTQVQAAYVAAGVNGVVRFPLAGSPYSMNLTHGISRQTWQLETISTRIAGTVTMAAPDVTLQGGFVNNILYTRSAMAPRSTIKNCIIDSPGAGIQMGGSHDHVTILNCEFRNQTLDFIHFDYDQGPDPDMVGVQIENCIGVRTAGVTRSMISGQDGGGLHKMFDFRVKNCRLDGGTSNQGWFGIEVWNNERNGAGRGGIVEYSDIRGGRCLMSMVRSRDNWIHHNLLDLNACFSGYESSGTTHVGGLIENNRVTGVPGGSSNHRLVYHNSGATGLEVRQNQISDLGWVASDPGPGGGMNIHDNCLQNVSQGVVAPNGPPWTVNNITSNNGPTFGPCA